MNLKTIKNQTGQALLFVVVAMTIALAVAISASVRTISSLSRTSRTDTASRALSAAEGGLERYLQASVEDLQRAIRNNTCVSSASDGEYDHQTNTCTITFASSGDPIRSQARVSIEPYEPKIYLFEARQDEVREVNLDGFNRSEIKICWNGKPASALTYFLYNKGNNDATTHGGIYNSSSGKIPSSPFTQTGFTAAGGGVAGYDACQVVDIANQAYGLRILSVGGDSEVRITSNHNNINQMIQLPLQGFKIISEGRITEDDRIVASRRIHVVLSLPYLPAGFDYSIYTSNGILK